MACGNIRNIGGLELRGGQMKWSESEDEHFEIYNEIIINHKPQRRFATQSHLICECEK